MVANWRLGCGALAFMMMGTQSAQALEWELIHDIRSDASPGVPVQQLAPIQASIHVMPTGPEANKPENDQGLQPGQSKGVEDLVETEDPRGEFITKESSQDNMAGDSTPYIERSKTIESRPQLEQAASRQGNAIIDNGYQKKSQSYHSLGIEATSEHHPVSAIDDSPRIDSDRSLGIRKWELVTDSTSIVDEPITQTRNAEQSIAWELVPSGDEISVNEIIDEMIEQKTQRLNAEEKVNQVIGKKTKQNWLTRLFSGMRNKPMEHKPMNEEPIPNDNDADHIAEEVKQEAIELSSVLIEHLTLMPVEKGGLRDEQIHVNQVIHDRDITSEITIGISGIELDVETMDNPNELTESINTSVTSEEMGVKEQIWSNKKLGSAVPLIQIRF
jgi:hypothetical protein